MVRGEADDPDKPGRLVLQLEATRAGRRWLREHLDEVRKPIDSGEGWVSCQKFMALRLLGKQPLDALFDREAALVFLASHAIRPAFKSAFRELRCEIHYDRVKFHEGQLTRPELRAITPSDAGAGRAVLLAIIDKAIERLWRLDAEHAEADEILELAESNIVSNEETKPVGQIQRHLESSNRLVIRNLDTIKRWHRWEDEGWGKARREREKLKEQARRGQMSDLRFVLDERGTVRDAQGYDGDLEAGLARWKAERGRQPCEDPYDRAPGAGGGRYTCGIVGDVGAKVENPHSPCHPSCTGSAGATQSATSADGTRSVPATPEHWQSACHTEQSRGHTEAEIGDAAADSGQVGPSAFVPLSLTGQEPASNIQNEIDGSGMNEDGVEEKAGDRPVGGDGLGVRELGRIGEDGGETFGRGGGGDASGAGDPGRTDRGDGGDRSGAGDPGRTRVGEEETYGRADGGVGDPRRTDEEETYGRADGGDPSSAQDPRRPWEGVVAGAGIRDGAANLGQAGVSDFVPLTLTGQEPATNIQNGINGDGSGMNDVGVEEGAGDRVVGGDGLVASEAGRTVAARDGGG